MLRLHSCASHHFWESAEDPASARCPTCGKPAETSPLFTADEPFVAVVEAEVVSDGEEIRVEGYEIVERLDDHAPALRAYRAKQVKTGREVRLDVVVAAEDSTQHAWARLRSQASAAAKLSHPHVPAVYDSGERERKVFYNAAELIAGPTLAEKVAKKPVPRRVALDLVEQLARLVDFAHERDVLHRHLEPACVVLQPITPPPSTKSPARDDPGGGVLAIHSGYYLPRIEGWGAARKSTDGDLADADLFDEPGNMAPEQASGKSQDVGKATDVYGLGAILYFLLTGVQPFRGETLSEVIDAVTTAHLLRPSQLARVPADLEAVCLKALSRNPRRRYASAADFADDLRRVRTHQEPRCYDGGGSGRLFRWMRRNPAWATGLVTTTLGLAVAAFGLLWGMSGERTSGPKFKQMQAELQSHQSKVTAMQGQLSELRGKEQAREARGLVRVAQSLFDQGNRNDANQALNRVAPGERKFEWHLLKRTAEGGSAREIVRTPGNLIALAVSRTDGHVATAHLLNDSPVVHMRWFDPPRRRWQQSQPWEPLGLSAMCFSPNGTMLLTTWGDSPGKVAAQNVLGFPALGPPGGDKSVIALPVTLSPGEADEVLVASSSGRVMRLTAAGEPLGFLGQDRIGRADRRVSVLPRNDGVVAVALSDDTRLRFYRPDERSAIRDVMLPQEPTAAAISSKNLLALGTKSGEVRLTDPFDPTAAAAVLPKLASGVKHLAFSKDGTRLLAIDEDGKARVYAETVGEWAHVAEFASPGMTRAEFTWTGNTVVGIAGQLLVSWGE